MNEKPYLILNHGEPVQQAFDIMPTLKHSCQRGARQKGATLDARQGNAPEALASVCLKRASRTLS